jgi:alcohol dehydrogenase class IV
MMLAAYDAGGSHAEAGCGRTHSLQHEQMVCDFLTGRKLAVTSR